MLKEAIEKIVSLAEAKTFEIDGRTYSDRTLHRIDPPFYTPEEKSLCSLDGLVKLLKAEYNKIVEAPLFINVVSARRIDVFSTYTDKYFRHNLYRVTSPTPQVNFGWCDYETAMISIRSQFVPNEGTEYLLGLLSKITDENSVQTSDNGLSQTVEVKKGISLKAKEELKRRISLRPFRTFLEVEQPESEFILRLQEGGRVGLFEADGGAWELRAKQNVSEYLEQELADLIERGVVVVTR